MPPLLTIITVTLNNRDTIAQTLCSVAAQSCRDVEHLVIDGGSTDGTLDIVNQHRNSIAGIVSEPDAGIYDAMNKGIERAQGEIVGILNADDVYRTEQTLAQVAELFRTPDTEACYGDLVYVHSGHPEQVKRMWRAGPYTPDKFYYGWMPPHPTFFVRKACYDAYGPYRTDMGTSADYELLLRYLLCHRLRVRYLPEVLVAMKTGGASNGTIGRRIAAHLMDWRAWRVNGLRPYPWTLPLKPLRKIPQWFCRS